MLDILATLISVSTRWFAGRLAEKQSSLPPSADRRGSGNEQVGLVYRAYRDASALQLACSLGDAEGVQIILESLAGDDDVLGAIRSRAGSALAAAAGKNHILLRLLYEGSLISVEHLRPGAYEALKDACSNSAPLSVKFFLGVLSADTPPEKLPWMVSSEGVLSPLSIACSSGGVQVLDSLFIGAGLSPETINHPHICIAVGLACKHRQADILMYLRDKRVITRELLNDSHSRNSILAHMRDESGKMPQDYPPELKNLFWRPCCH